MKNKKLEERVIELYEMVAVQAITPNHAREEFMKLIRHLLLKERNLLLAAFQKLVPKYEVVYEEKSGILGLKELTSLKKKEYEKNKVSKTN